jgi:hypothetical protein
MRRAGGHTGPRAAVSAGESLVLMTDIASSLITETPSWTLS